MSAEYLYQVLQEAITDEGGVVPCHNYPDLFFPDIGENPNKAKAVCQTCPVRLQCLQYALAANEVYGVWGGMSAYERNRLLKNAG